MELDEQPMLNQIRLLTVKIRTQNERPACVMKILVSVKDYVALSSPVCRRCTSVQAVTSFVKASDAFSPTRTICTVMSLCHIP
jgi:hypothetical protein